MDFSPRFRSVWSLTLLYGVLLTALGLLLGKPARIWTFSESGPFEVFSIASWLLLAALCFAAPGLSRRRTIAPGLLALAAGAREADLHKAFTPESIFKLKFYLTSVAAPLEKIVAGAVTLLILGVAITMLIRAWRALSSRGNWRQDWTRTTTLGLAMLAFCGSLDRLQNIVHDLTGQWLPHTLGKVIPAWEEGFESLLPLIFVAALLQYRASMLAMRDLRVAPATIAGLLQ